MAGPVLFCIKEGMTICKKQRMQLFHNLSAIEFSLILLGIRCMLSIA